jgi:hypothetical protein
VKVGGDGEVEERRVQQIGGGGGAQRSGAA